MPQENHPNTPDWALSKGEFMENTINNAKLVEQKQEITATGMLLALWEIRTGSQL